MGRSLVDEEKIATVGRYYNRFGLARLISEAIYFLSICAHPSKPASVSTTLLSIILIILKAEVPYLNMFNPK
jgi:hypothetical protein